VFREYEVIRLGRNKPANGLLAGATGTILMIYTQLPLPPAYEVEFTDAEGNTVALLALQDEEIEKVGNS